MVLKKDSNYNQLMIDVNDDIYKERERQNAKWGHQRHSHETWHVIGSEETGEVAQAIQAVKGWGKPTDAQDLYTECIHASAVYAAFAEQVLEEMREKATRLHD